MFRFVTATLVALLVGTAKADEPPKKVPTAADVLRQFQGTWQVESWEEGGKAVEDLKKRGVFFGANVFLLRRDDKPFQGGTFQLDPGKSPATINLTVREGEGKDDVMLGIYALEGDALKLCFDPKSQARPKNFRPDAKDGFTLITLKRPRPPANEAIDVVGKYHSELVDARTGEKTLADVLVEKRGDAYIVTYKHEDKILFIGTAMRKGDQFSMCWASGSQVGVSIYKIEPGPKLTGEYTMLGGIGVTGKETLTPWRKVD